MKHLIFFDSESHQSLRPLTLTRAVADLRIGINTIAEKWCIDLGSESYSYYTQDYLKEKYGFSIKDDNFIINASILPNRELVDKVKKLKYKEALVSKGTLIAAHIDQDLFESLENESEFDHLQGYEIDQSQYYRLSNLWNIVEYNRSEILNDIQRLSKISINQLDVDQNNTIIGDPNLLFSGHHVNAKGCHFDLTDGPIYLGDHSVIMPGSNIKGPVAILENAVVKMGSQIYAGTTIGPDSVAGGEIKNSIIGDFSNKGHSGYLGDSVIGRWCNLGANTNVSNLKNNYSNINLWNSVIDDYQKTPLIKCGLFCGDHVHTGINSMFNSGSYVGAICNIVGSGFQPKYIPSLSWKVDNNFTQYEQDKAIQSIQKMMKLKGQNLSDINKKILLHLYQTSSDY